MNQKLYGTRLYINCADLERNINYIRNNSKMQIIAMVKANAYGHGDIMFCKQIEKLGIKYFGVADFEEGLRLRNSGIMHPIMVMNPGIKNIPTILNNNLEPVIYNLDILHQLTNMVDSKTINYSNIPIHIKLNTGMNRWGLNESEIPVLVKKITDNRGIKILSIYSHLASADHDDAFTKQQISVFKTMVLSITEKFNYNIKTHIYNSRGFLKFHNPLDTYTFARIGIALYG